MSLHEEAKTIARTSIWTMILNGFLALCKILAGIFGKSTAMISDAVNSISDVLTNLVVMIFGKFSRKEKDESHPYGHEKFDSMISVFIGIGLIVTAFEIGKQAATMLYDYFVNGVDIVSPKWIALVVAFTTIIIKETMYRFTKVNAKKAKSQALFAMALDNRSDELASFGAAIGIGGAMLGWVYLEPIASIIICLFIIRLGFRIIRSGFSQVVDHCASLEVIEQIKAIVLSFPEVRNLDDLKTRMFGMKLYVDLEIAVDADLSLAHAHEIAEKIHDEIEEQMTSVKHCMIHLNPYKH